MVRQSMPLNDITNTFGVHVINLHLKRGSMHTFNSNNKSISLENFPGALKIVIIKPLFKKGENNCFNNYRPISPLPTISNIF